ncbi:hypothetical protein [Modicisalibacter xianhensis]|nr:hypothetical protein [Halomonas xianhensis]
MVEDRGSNGKLRRNLRCSSPAIQRLACASLLAAIREAMTFAEHYE